MKGCQLFLIFLLAATHAIANNSDTGIQPAAASVASNNATTTASMRTSALTVRSVAKPSKPRHKPAAQANLADFGGRVVHDMRAGSAFVQGHAVKAGGSDTWLIALAAFGLVFFQLRRKHKSLPQRRIAPYA
jgi:hypothetical protein